MKHKSGFMKVAGGGLVLLAVVLGGWVHARARSGQEPYRTPLSAHLPKPLAEISVVAVGDIMMHADVKQAAQQAEDQADGGFPALWADLVPLFKGADLAFANLETPVAPKTGRPGKPYQFNAPEALPGALRASGWTVLSTANNHAFDQGKKGVKETLERLKEARLTTLGSGEDKTEAEQPRIFEKDGMKVALLGFTDLFNLDLNQKASEPWVRQLDVDSALEAIRAARKQADAVLVSIHWGDEYSHTPTKRHRDIAKKLIEGGADVVLGHHPHVLQPMELMEVVNPDGTRRTGLVAFSLGNFISNQDRMYQVDLFPVAAGDSRDGAALQFSLSKVQRPDGSLGVVLGDVAYEPLWVENNWREMRTVKGAKRQIRVIRIRAALDRVRRELDQLSDPVEGPKAQPDEKARKAAIQGLQEQLRTLLFRKARILAVVGQGFEAR